MRRLPLVAITALVLASGAGAASPRVVVRPVPETQMRMGVPTGWKSIDRAEAIVLAQRVATLNPQIATLVQALAGHGSLIKLVTYDPHTAGSFATNANVVAQPSPSSSLASAVSQELPLVRRVLHPSGLTQKAIRIAGRPADKISYTAVFNAPSGRTSVAQTQIYVIDRGILYVVTLTTSSGLRAAYSSTFAAIVSSLSFG